MIRNSCNRLRWAAAGITVWTFLLAFWIYCYSIRHGGMASWDGFERCAWGANIWRDLRHGDILQFWLHTHEQVVWPFLHSWIAGGLFLLFGPSLAAARLISLCAYAGTPLLIFFYILGGESLRRQSQDEASIFKLAAGAAAWGLFTCSPLAIQQAAGIMSELPGLFLSASMLALIPQEKPLTIRRAAAAGFIMALLFFFKYNFAVLTFAAVTLTRTAQVGFHIRRLATKADALLFGLPIALFVLWLIPDFSHKMEGLIGFALNNPAARAPLRLSSFWHYPRLIPFAYFPIPALFFLCLGVVAAGAILSPRLRLGNPFAAGLLIHFLAAVFHPMKDIRFIFIPMGFFFVLTGEAICAVLLLWAKQKLWMGRAAVGITAIIAGSCVLYQYGEMKKPHVSQSDIHLAPMRSIADRIAPADHIAFLAAHDILHPPAISFYLIAGLNKIQADGMGGKNWDYLYLFESVDSVQWISPEQRIKDLRHRLFLLRANKIVAIQSTAPEKIPNYKALFAGTNEYAELVPQLTEFEKMWEKTFPRADMVIRIYRLKK
ncbi:MAG: hypothetical protein AB1656_18010 [Candidatus Omnitrophota bacterium]